MTTDRRILRNVSSVLALFELLQEVIQKPSIGLELDGFVQALKSQGALAKYSNETKKIIPSSLNTIKRIAEKSIDGGFDSLNKLRRNALDAIEAEASSLARPNPSSKAYLKERIAELRQLNEQMQQDLLLISMILEKALQQGMHYAQSCGNDKLISLCKQEQRELLDMLSLRRHPTPRSNLISLHDD